MASTRAMLAAAFGLLLADAVDAHSIPGEPALLQLDSEPQPVADALNRLAEAAGLQIVFYSDTADGVIAPRLSGYYTARDALDRLLMGTNLQYEFMSERAVAIRNVSPPAEASTSAPPSDANVPPQSPAMGEEVALVLEEVMVTARRRTENLQRTPVAVTALSGEALELRMARTAEALAQFVPNLQYDGAAPLSGAAYNATIFIRGVGQNDFAIFSDPGVAVYLDGVYLGRTIGGALDLLDLDRVEVLRGPQGTLFGRNTIGGAINLVSRQPEAGFGAEMSLTAGSLERREVRGTLNLPLGDSLSARIVAATLRRDGYSRRLTDGTELGDKDTTLARGQVLWQPSDDFSALLALDMTSVRQRSAPLTLIGVADGGVPFLNLYNSLVAPSMGVRSPAGSNVIDPTWIAADIDTTYASGTSINELDSLGAALTLDWDTRIGKLRSMTAWRTLDAVFARDGDNTPFTFRETFNDDWQRQFSEELHLSASGFGDRLEWLVGLYYFDEAAREDGNATLARGLYAALESLALDPGQTWCGLPGANPRPAGECPESLRYGGTAWHDNNVRADLDVDLHTRVANRSIALFGQGTWRFTPRLSATAGLRWTRDQKEIELVHRRLGSGEYIVGEPGTQREFSAAWAELTPKLGIEWQGTPDTLLYASYARGFKSGGFNGRPLVDSGEVSTPYEPEFVDSFEVGAKTRWFDGRMTANAAMFYNEYRDMQLSINATPQNYVRNAGESRIFGAELEVVARLAAGLDLNVATGWLDTRYTRLDPQLATLRPPITLDKEFIKAPQWTGSAGLQYRRTVGSGDWLVRGDYSYRSRMYHDVFNDPRLAQPGFDLLNAYAAFATADQRWELGVFCTNLTAERYRISGNSSAAFGLAESTFSPPREVGATLRLKF